MQVEDSRYTRSTFELELMVLRLTAAAKTPVGVVEAAPWLCLAADCDLGQQSSVLGV